MRDYVTPLVRSDVRNTQLTAVAPPAVRGGRRDRRLHSHRYRTTLLRRHAPWLTNSRRKRHRILALIAAGAMALVVALIVAVVWIVIRQPEKSDDRRPADGRTADAVPPTRGSRARSSRTPAARTCS